MIKILFSGAYARTSSTTLISVLFLSLLLSACGGSSSSSGGAAANNDASLSALSVSGVTMDQAFQSNQLSYTASVNYLIGSARITATTTNSAATLIVNGVTTTSGEQTTALALAEGDNTLTVAVTAADGSTTQTYTIAISRQSASIFAQQAYVKASNAETLDEFGFSVAISGDTLVVGALYESGDATSTAASPNNGAGAAGAAYVFVRANGVWTQEAYLKASNAEAGDSFGSSVAIDTDTIVVGAIYESGDATSTAASPNNAALYSGAAYVFTRSNGVWAQEAYLKASNAGAGDSFGYSAAISGNTVVVGAYSEAGDATSTAANPNDASINAGAAYVFVRTNGLWTQQAYLKARDTVSGYFGYSVAIDGDTVVVGSYGDAAGATSAVACPDSSVAAGAAYVFLRSNGAWTQQAYLTASNVEGCDYFGYSVAIAGDTVVVGASFEGGDATSTTASPNNAAYEAGAAYVFVRSAGVWSQQAYLKASNAEANDRFGWSVAISGDSVVVGAIGESGSVISTAANPDNNIANAGAAYVYVRSDGVWSQQAYLKASNSGIVDYLGSRVAISGDTVVVGAYHEAGDATSTAAIPNNSAVDAGAAYVFQ